MKRLLLIVLPLLLIVGCSKPVEESTLIDKDGVMYLPDSDSPYSGEVFINYSTGEKLYQGTYENGLLVQYSYLNRDGSGKEPLNESTLLKRGELMYEANATKPYTGQVFELYANGQKAFEGIYKDGFRHGDWAYYTEVGNGKYNVAYTADTYTVVVFTDNLGTDYAGSPSRHREAYQDGTYFLRKEDKYDFSKFPESFGTYKNGKKDGLWTYWYENGQKWREETYKDGNQDGLWTSWYEDGREIVPIIPDVVAVQGGTFQMGSNFRYSHEKPVHSVTVSDYSMSKTEVTFEQYDAFCDATGSDKPDDEGWGRGDRPVINVSWHDAVAFCEWMSKVTGKTYRLPTEAEWEYAARGGNKSKGYTYSGGNDLDAVGWYKTNSGSKTHPVEQKQPNELGLYDMSGNVWEWCSDWYDKGYYSGSPQTDPQGSNSGDYRVLRGGSWGNYVISCRVADRYGADPVSWGNNGGFRLVLSQD